MSSSSYQEVIKGSNSWGSLGRKAVLGRSTLKKKKMSCLSIHKPRNSLEPLEVEREEELSLPQLQKDPAQPTLHWSSCGGGGGVGTYRRDTPPRLLETFT